MGEHKKKQPDEVEELQDLLGAGEMLRALDEFAENSLKEAKRLNELAQSVKINDVGALYAAAAMDNEKIGRLVKTLSPLLWNILTLLNSVVQTITRLTSIVDKMAASLPKTEDFDEINRKLDELQRLIERSFAIMERLYEKLEEEARRDNQT